MPDSCGFFDVGRFLWREDGSVVYNCCWASPAHSFSGPSPVGLATIFYCLRFGTSLFVASYDSQGYCGGIRLRLHAGLLPRLVTGYSCNSRHRLEGSHVPYLSSKKSLLCNLHFVAVDISFQQLKLHCVQWLILLEPLRSNGHLFLNAWERIYLFIS
jgi:hypothetical protein